VSSGGKSADEDGDEDEKGGAVERQWRRVCDSARVFHPPSTLLIPCRCSPQEAPLRDLAGARPRKRRRPPSRRCSPRRYRWDRRKGWMGKTRATGAKG